MMEIVLHNILKSFSDIVKGIDNNIFITKKGVNMIAKKMNATIGKDRRIIIYVPDIPFKMVQKTNFRNTIYIKACYNFQKIEVLKGR